MGNITRAKPSMIYHAPEVEAGDVLLSDGEEYTSGKSGEADELAVMLTDDSRYDEANGTLILVHTNNRIVRITGFDQTSSGMSSTSGGRRGPRGLTGRTGKTGRNGRDGQNGNDGCTGPKGDTGPQGNTGPTGVQGDIGHTGATGATGASGATGARGDDATAGKIIESDEGTCEVVEATGRKFQYGHMNADKDTVTVTVLFPIAFDVNVAGLQLTFTDAQSYQAQNYRIIDADLGGITLTVPSVPTEDWDFYWEAKGI